MQLLASNISSFLDCTQCYLTNWRVSLEMVTPDYSLCRLRYVFVGLLAVGVLTILIGTRSC